eukprot:Phypoly_transcript_07464.p1 GENE.Phypoly_transcript_07464~~Phypoly_transcript_07464.p1  ORF type:complete len:472 (+),score=46.87 Phypoly_transcript_07464:174-1589(+)
MAFFSLVYMVILIHLSHGITITMYPNTTLITPDNQFSNSTTTIEFTYRFTTISAYPAPPTNSTPFILSHSAIDDCECTFQGDVSGKVVIFEAGALPSLWGCNRAHVGRALALGRMVQKQGAIGLVIPAQEKYMSGQVVGFGSDLTIPVLVTPASFFSFVKENANLIVSIELPPTTQKDIDKMTLLSNIYLAWLLIVLALYCVLIIFMSTIVILDAERLYKKRKYFSHGHILRMSSLGSVLSCFVWIIMDPASGITYKWWYPSVAYYFHLLFYICSLLCLVRMWTLASTSAIAFLQEPGRMSTITYSVIAVVSIAGVFGGVFWFSDAALHAFVVFYFGGLLTAGIAFVIFGKLFWATFTASGNTSPGSKILPRKIAVFIMLYIAFAIVDATMYFLQPLGIVFGYFFTSLYISLAYLSLFLLLLFPKMEQQQIKANRKQRQTFASVSFFVSPSIELSTRTESQTDTNVSTCET